jgi:DNA-binding SARP family transcriptional activator
MDFRILGPLEVAVGDELLELTGARQRALLAILLLHGGEAVSTDRLIDELWGDDPPGPGGAALRVRVSQLRRALGAGGALLVTRAPGYALALGPDQLDLRRFERLVEAGGRALAGGDPAAAAERLSEGLALWRGHHCRTWATRRSRSRRSPAWRSSVWRRSSYVWMHGSPSANMRAWSVSCRRSSRTIRCASGFAGS